MIVQPDSDLGKSEAGKARADDALSILAVFADLVDAVKRHDTRASLASSRKLRALGYSVCYVGKPSTVGGGS